MDEDGSRVAASFTLDRSDYVLISDIPYLSVLDLLAKEFMRYHDDVKSTVVEISILDDPTIYVMKTKEVFNLTLLRMDYWLPFKVFCLARYIIVDCDSYHTLRCGVSYPYTIKVIIDDDNEYLVWAKLSS